MHAPYCGKKQFTSSRISQLLTNNICLWNIPIPWMNVLTNYAPCLIEAYFYSTLMRLAAIYKPNITIIADDPCILCIIIILLYSHFMSTQIVAIILNLTCSALNSSIVMMTARVRSTVGTVKQRQFSSSASNIIHMNWTTSLTKCLKWWSASTFIDCNNY